MYKTKTFTIFASIILLLASCSLQDNKTDELLDQAEELLIQQPDSALRLLETVTHPRTLSEKLYNRYSLLHIQAKDKNFKKIADDTLFYRVKDYYLKAGDMPKAALAEYYSARILHAQKRHSEAMLKYKDAEQYAETTNDQNLKGIIQFWIGDLYFDQFMKDEAMALYKQAAVYLHNADMYTSEMMAYNKIGTLFLMKAQQDSALHYYNKSFVLAQQQKDSLGQASAMKNIGLVYDNAREGMLARTYYRKALTLSSDKERTAKTYLSIAYSFNAEKNRDSTLFYIDRSQEQIKEKASHMMLVYQLLADISKNDGNYKAAFEYQEKYTQELRKDLTQRNNQAIFDVQKKYNFERIENENNHLLIQRQTFGIVVLGLVVLILVLLFVFYRKNTKNKNELKEANTNMAQLQEMAEGYKEEKKSFRNVVLQHFDVLKKVALMDKHLNGDEKKQGSKLLKKFNEIVYKQEKFDWNMMYDAMKHAYNNFPENLRKLYPQLDESEVRICCLTYGELNNTDISILMQLSINTIQSKKSTIRKKMGIEGYGNIKDFLDKKMNNPKPEEDSNKTK